MARRKRADKNAMTFQGDTDDFSLWRQRIEASNHLWDKKWQEVRPYYSAYKGEFIDPISGKSLSANSKYIGVPLAYAHVKFKVPMLTLKQPFAHISARTPFTPEPEQDDAVQDMPMPGAPPMDPMAAGGMPPPPMDPMMGGQPPQPPPMDPMAMGGMPPPQMMDTMTPQGPSRRAVRDNVVGAEILESAINYEIKQMKYKEEAKCSIQDALFFYGVTKLGYDSGPATSPRQEIADIEAEIEGEEDSREGLEDNDAIRRQSIWALRVSPWDFRYDPTVKKLDPDLSQARWVAFRSIRPLDDVKSDPIYKNTAGLEGTLVSDPHKIVTFVGGSDSHDGDSQELSDSASQAPMDRYVILWEIWDKKDRKIRVLAEGHKKFLRDEPWPYDLKAFPMAFLRFNDIPDEPFPMSDFAPWYQQNLVLNIAESMDVESMRRRLDKVFYKKGAITEDQLNSATDALAKQFVEVNDPDPAALREFKSSAQEVQLSQVVHNRASQRQWELSGVSGNQRGIQETEGTATEAAIIQTNVEARNQEARDRVTDWMECAIHKMISLMKQFFTQRRIVPILGREDQEWIPYNKDNIQGEYDVEVTISGHDPNRPELIAKQIVDLLALAMRFPGGMIPDGMGGMYQMNFVKLLDEYMRATGSKLKLRDVVVGPTMMMPPGAPPPGAEGGAGGQPQPGGAKGGKPPLPGEGSGADARSMMASQGAGAAAAQAIRENALAGSATSSTGA